jgi:Outer membrane protein beta-barrel domain
MKKITLIFFLAVTCTAAQAQFGIKAGLNVANWGGSDADDEGKKSLMGIYGGVYYNLELSENISVQPELVYSGQGVKYEASGTTAKVVLGYVNLTPLLRYNSSGGFFVGIGPQIGFLTSAKTKVDGESDEDVKDQFKGTDFAAVIAIGFEMENGFGVYARYNHGISKIPDASDVKVYNRVFQVGLRYNLTKGEHKKKD